MQRSTGGLLLGDAMDVDDDDDDDRPPPTPMWSNTPPVEAQVPKPSSLSKQPSGSMGAAAGAAGTVVQRHWRGLRGRWKVVQRLTWVVSSGLDRIEEQAMLDLSGFLQSISESGQMTLERAPSSDPRSSLSLSPSYTGEHLSFPLTESTVLDIVSAFCRDERVHKAFVSELLTNTVKLMTEMPNVRKCTVPSGCSMAIVGDLHGQFSDLMHIFRCHGFPSPERPYLFNGDFVDRGDCGVEVTLTLFAWQLLYPGSVFLNRGNHEERSIHALYGFQRECTTKYDQSVYDLFNDAFEQLPLATVINDKVLVLHGGIDDQWSVEDLNKAPRAEYVVNAQNSSASSRQGLVHPAMRARMAELAARDEMLKPINSALWNDPMKASGTCPNKPRGTGLLFGADIAAAFLEKNGLGLILRSHEQVMAGFDWPFGVGLYLATVFSASNYAGKTKNKGAYALLSAAGETAAVGQGAEKTVLERRASGSSAISDMCCEQLTPSEDPSGLSCHYPFGHLRFLQYEADHIPSLRVQQRNAHLLISIIFAHRSELLASYAAADTVAAGRLPMALWASETQRVLEVSFSLMSMRYQLLGAGAANEATVDYNAFLQRFRLACPELSPMYVLREYLLALMYKVDSDGAGTVTLRELSTVCKVLERHFENVPPLCTNQAEQLRALGPVGARAQASGVLSISEVADQFRVLVPSDPTPPSLIDLLHRLDRDDLRAAAHSAGSPGSGTRDRRGSSVGSSSGRSDGAPRSDARRRDEARAAAAIEGRKCSTNPPLLGLIVDDPELSLPPVADGRDHS